MGKRKSIKVVHTKLGREKAWGFANTDGFAHITTHQGGNFTVNLKEILNGKIL